PRPHAVLIQGPQAWVWVRKVRVPHQRRSKNINPIRKAIIAVAMVGSTLAGGAVGTALLTGNSANAATTPSANAPASSSSGPSAANTNGTFHPNETAAHEAGESAAREAQEDAGQVPTVP